MNQCWLLQSSETSQYSSRNSKINSFSFSTIDMLSRVAIFSAAFSIAIDMLSRVDAPRGTMWLKPHCGVAIFSVAFSIAGIWTNFQVSWQVGEFMSKRDIQRGKFELIVLFPLTGQAILIYLTTLCPLLLVTVVIFSLLL
ncbi:hypothetical protein P8452_48125 [Trifolium repens]|nr:hypothetical protein P8452_48125 [Trifolium repens]